MKALKQTSYSVLAPEPYNEEFFDDLLELFLGTKTGHVGKYIYEDSAELQAAKREHDYLWKDVIEQENPSYYLPKADNVLLQTALSTIGDVVPLETNVVDFGVGGTAAFNAHIRPFLDALSSPSYVGLDFCEGYLDAIKEKQADLPSIKISTVNMDFFESQRNPVSPTPALGIMTCGTIGNIYGSIRDRNVDLNLTRSLKTVSSLTKNGWLLISIDTNQTESSLMAGYATSLMERLFLTVFERAPKELPLQGFNPSLFTYAPEWHPEVQLFAHIAEATQSQDFMLGDYQLHIERGQKFHLLNSYKFRQDFFESCCDKANLEILKVWHHESPMKLYLLMDRANPLYDKKALSAVA